MASGVVRWTPAVLHVDMDSFFASVEVLDDPRLAGRPVIVGGSGERAVVASCTYEARAYGIRSAMPSLRARRLCPDAVFVEGRYSRYAEVSAKLHDILLAFTPLVEPIGLDEAFLDVTGSRQLLGSPERIAGDIRRRVSDELRLACSVGIGRSKMIAKLASRAAKPTVSAHTTHPGAGVVGVDPADELSFLHPLPVEALWGVGPATAARLHGLGLRTVGDLAGAPVSALVLRLGSAQGRRLSDLSRGMDPDPVVPGRQAKSIGHEETFAVDIVDRQVLERHAVRMAESVAIQLRASSLQARTVTVKLKFPDLSVVSRSHTLGVGIDTPRSVATVVVALLGSVEIGPGVRLLGVAVSGFQGAKAAEQLRFDGVLSEASAGDGGGGAEIGDGVGPVGTAPGDAVSTWDRAGSLQEDWREISTAVDSIRERFGPESVGTAAMVDDTGITIPRRREAPWGPAADGV
ncbi:MAG: DNA polymerase IV [Acidimicrobiales bacterium]